MHYDLVSASALSGSTAAHMPAICDLLQQILHLQQHRLGQYLFWEHNWGMQITKQGRKKKNRDQVRYNGFAQYQGSI